MRAPGGMGTLSSREWSKGEASSDWIDHCTAYFSGLVGNHRLAFSPVIVSCDSHSAGCPEKAYPRSTGFICRVCGSGVWGSLRWGLGSRDSVESEQCI